MSTRARTFLAALGVLVATFGFALGIHACQAADDGVLRTFTGAFVCASGFIGGLILFFGGALCVLGSMAAE